MIKNNLGQIIINEQEAFEALYSGKLLDLENVLIEGDIDRFNKFVDINADKISKIQNKLSNDLSMDIFDKNNQTQWFMPDEYKTMDIEGYLIYKCPKQNYDRLHKELILYRKNNMIDLLRYLKYLMDTIKTNNVIHGIGRGSSVASYTLYLLGVHYIDSIKYNLDVNEFFKENNNGL